MPGLIELSSDTRIAVLVIALLVLSLGIHEYAHAWVALRCGDTTARDAGRLTPNPLAHVDLFMTIVLPLALYLSGGPIFGGAKPVPVNPSRLRHPLRDMVFVAIAGPLSNLLLAILFAILFRGLAVAGVIDPGLVIWKVFRHAIELNCLLVVFNLLPIPPLDGSRVLTYFLPPRIRASYVALEPIGFFLVMLLLYTGVLTPFVWSSTDWLRGVVDQVATLGGVW